MAMEFAHVFARRDVGPFNDPVDPYNDRVGLAPVESAAIEGLITEFGEPGQIVLGYGDHPTYTFKAIIELRKPGIGLAADYDYLRIEVLTHYDPVMPQVFPLLERFINVEDLTMLTKYVLLTRTALVFSMNGFTPAERFFDRPWRVKLFRLR